MATSTFITSEDSSSFDISIGTLDSEKTSSCVDFIKDAGISEYDIDDTSSQSTASFAVPCQSKVRFHDDSSHDSFNSFTVETSSRLTDDLHDIDLEEASTFVDPDDLMDYLSPGKGTGTNPSTLTYSPSLDSTSSTPICESHTTFTGHALNPITRTGLFNLPPDSAFFNNQLFKDLLAVLLDECKLHLLPMTLIDMCTQDSTKDVNVLQKNFSHSYLQRTNQQSEIFPDQFKLNETEPVKVLNDSDSSCSYIDSVKSRFDLNLHTMMNRVEKSGNLLDDAAKDSKKYASYIPRQRPMLSRRAVEMMEEWYASNYEHPYPNNLVLEAIAKAGDNTKEQAKKWFANKRHRCKNPQKAPDTERLCSGK
ncbi:hypothetical protein CHS0354_005816 [Potamilus streckersoni]|uniref:Homeobox domain-containing protein n=1 Tax=Potamilus streckersoni TaxID=2493646 RepID=A0AAE0SUR2_9BIVA|nr:hypothetical protein CHS0354_005816 [Potamilus streckersoni]